MDTPPCAGCLGSRECWVCIGVGVIERERGEPPKPCRRCLGSGICSYCQTITVEDVGASPLLTVERRVWRRRRGDRRRN